MKTMRVVLGILLLLVSCAPQKKEPSLIIAAAANMQFAIQALAEKFSDSTGIPCELIVSSSGKLTAQIIEGAPYQVFVSADMKYPETLYKKGLTASSPKVYAYGKLVLWSAQEDIEPSLDLLNQEKIEHIALANPKTAPYGAAAVEVLEYHGMYHLLEHKLVYGESIAQANQFINSQAAQLGFTALSVVISSRLKNKGQWVAMDSSTYTPIRQGIVLLKSDRERQKEARVFYDFLDTKAAHEILRTYGYSIHE